MKIECVSGSLVQTFMKFIFKVCQVEGYRIILKLSCRLFAFTSHKVFLEKKEV